MNKAIADILKAKIENLDFVDKIAGLVAPVYVDMVDENNNRVQKCFPVSCTTTAQDCKLGAYNDLCPDSKYKTVIYFEDRGVTFDRREGKFIYYRSNLRLVCWINAVKLENDGCADGTECSLAADLIKDIVCALPEFPENISPFAQVMPVVTSQEIRSNAIFSAYTYNEKQVQYLMYPYDYFALDITTEFAVCQTCS
jgi:hypothetical protein